MAWEFLRKIQSNKVSSFEAVLCFMQEIQDYSEMPEVIESVVETLKEERPEAAAMIWGDSCLSDKQLANKFIGELWNTKNHLKWFYDFQELKAKRPGAVEIILKTSKNFREAGNPLTAQL